MMGYQTAFLPHYDRGKDQNYANPARPAQELKPDCK